MKLNKRRYALIPLFVIIALAISSFNNADSIKPDAASDESWSDSIAAALKDSNILLIDGEIIVVDTIPCSSSKGKVGLLGRLKGYTCIDCSTCKPCSGKPDPDSEGFCTVIRKYDASKY